MPTITCTRSDLERLAGVPCPIDGLEVQLELVKGEVKSYDAATDEVRIELNDTNRPDLWSVEGIARQLRIRRTGAPIAYPCFEKRAPGAEILVEPSVAGVRPFVGGFVAEDIEVTEPVLVGLIEQQEKLSENFGQRRRSLAIGIYPAAAIRFPVSYRASPPHAVRFVPLGMEEELDLAEILARHPKGLAYGKILAGCERYPLLVDAAGAVLSFPPVINSRTVGEVRPGDRALFVEATGTELSTVLLALNILAVNLSDRGARIVSCVSRYPAASAPATGRRVVVPHPLSTSVTVPRREFTRLLGMPFETGEIVRALRAYGCEATARGRGASVTVRIPPYRLDYLHPVDAVEDLAMSLGYAALAPELPSGFTVGALAPLTLLEDRIRDRLIGYAFEEVVTNVLTNRAAESDAVGRPDAPLVEIANVMSETYGVLRRSLLPSLLRVEAASATALYPHRTFEVGECAIVDEGAAEGSRTASILGVSLAHAAASFSELHSYLDRLCYDLGLVYRLVPGSGAPFVDGRHADIVAGTSEAHETTVGAIGEIHPEILTAWGIRTPVAALEMDLGAVHALL
jgi:phenylalanyl-tRNA synthetase beta chain